jgi:hypothetical protein
MRRSEKIEHRIYMEFCTDKMTARLGGNITENTTLSMTITSQQESTLTTAITSGNHKSPLWGTARYCCDWIKDGRHDPSNSDSQRILRLVRMSPNISVRDICYITHINKDWCKALIRELDKMTFFTPASSS